MFFNYVTCQKCCLIFPFFLSSAIKPEPVLNCLLCPPSLCSVPLSSLYMSFSLYYPWSGHYEYEERCTWHFSGYFIERPKVDFALVRLPSGQNRFERAFQFTNDSKMPVANSLLPATGCVWGTSPGAARNETHRHGNNFNSIPLRVTKMLLAQLCEKCCSTSTSPCLSHSISFSLCLSDNRTNVFGS